MKRVLFSLLAGLLCLTSLKAGELTLKGTFQGENLYVKNPFAPTGVGFCIYEVTVNGLTTTDEINSSAFEIDLGVYGFNIGDALSVSIRYKNDCLPKVLNAEVLNPRATFQITKLVLENTDLKWTTVKESGSLTFVVEQFRWNKWIKVGEVDGKGTPGENSYKTTVRLNSGENKFRIKQVDYRNKASYSSELVTTSTKEAVTFSTKTTDLITFSAETSYEIYDEFGGIVFKGYGKEVKIGTLNKGKYYLNYDNQMDRFTKK